MPDHLRTLGQPVDDEIERAWFDAGLHRSEEIPRWRSEKSSAKISAPAWARWLNRHRPVLAKRRSAPEK
jgi:hypothetical protein